MSYIIWLAICSLPIVIMLAFVQELSEEIRNTTLGGNTDEEGVEKFKREVKEISE